MRRSATPNFIIQEWLPTDVEWRDDLMGGPFEINLEVMKEHPYSPRDMNLYSRGPLVPRKAG